MKRDTRRSAESGKESLIIDLHISVAYMKILSNCNKFVYFVIEYEGGNAVAASKG
jgi:hypothetical protein